MVCSFLLLYSAFNYKNIPKFIYSVKSVFQVLAIMNNAVNELSYFVDEEAKAQREK